MYKKHLRDDITFKILSNYPFYSADIETDLEKFKQKLQQYDVGIFVNEKWKTCPTSQNGKLNDENIKVFNSLGEELSWEDLVLNYMKSLNTFMREQIGVCIDKSIPRVIDNELTYLIIQRKNKKEFSDMFFVAVNGEIIFPMISKKFDINLALIKLAEWKNRAGLKNLIKFQY